MSFTFDELEAEVSPQEKAVSVCLDGALLAEIERLEGEMFAASEVDKQENRDPQAPKIARRILELQEEARKKERYFVFRAVKRSEWSRLLADNAPTEAQRKNGIGAFNPEKFPPRAMAASCVQPELSIQQAEWLWENLSFAIAERIWNACLAVNAFGVTLGKDGKVTDALKAIAQSSTTSSPEESLGAST